MIYHEMYLWGLPGVQRLHCEFEDPHCEGPAAAADPRWEGPAGASTSGTGEPMTVISISLYNLWHPKGYRPPLEILALATDPSTRVVSSRFLAQPVTANGLEARFGDLYNFVTPHYAIGCASQAYSKLQYKCQFSPILKIENAEKNGDFPLKNDGFVL